MDDKAPEVEVLDLTTPEGQAAAGVRPAPADVPVEEGEVILTITATRRDMLIECAVHGLEKHPTWRADLHSDPRAHMTREAGMYCMEAYISVALSLLAALHSEGIVLDSEGEVKEPRQVAGFQSRRH